MIITFLVPFNSEETSIKTTVAIYSYYSDNYIINTNFTVIEIGIVFDFKLWIALATSSVIDFRFSVIRL